MREAAKGYLALAGSLTEVTRQRATAAARALVNQGEATAEQVGSLVDDLLTQSRQNREAVTALVTYEVDRTLGRLGLASDGEVAALVDRIQVLEAEVRRLKERAGQDGDASSTLSGTRAPASTAAARKSPARKPATKRSPAKKASTGAARPAAKTSPAAKKSPATKAPAKKSSGSGSASA